MTEDTPITVTVVFPLSDVRRIFAAGREGETTADVVRRFALERTLAVEAMNPSERAKERIEA